MKTLTSGHTIRLATACAILVAASASSRAQEVDYTQIATGLSGITDITNAGDGRLFIVEQAGRIRIVDAGGTLLPTPFLDIDARVQSGGERGLLGLAFHPSYASNGYFYVNYTDNDGDTVVSRFSVSPNADVADPGSESVILTQTQTFANHNGGDLNFGPADGYLYIGFGDGGSGCDPHDDAQDPTTFLGKILRIDVDGGIPYAIPPTNPFVGTPGTLDEIWAIGVRNPWRFGFDRMAPHDMWIGEVGQAAREEIDHQPGASAGGENYGWDCYEGTASSVISGCTTTAVCPPANDTAPVHEYDHGGGRCSVTGGFVYRGAQYPGFAGAYFFADFCSRDLYSLRPDGDGDYTLTAYPTKVASNPRTFGEDAAGEIYVGTSSTVYRLDDPSPPVSGCPAAPDPGCDLTTNASLTIRDALPGGASDRDKLQWKSWRGPLETQAGFGMPTDTTDYLWCLYAGASSSLIAEGGVAGGGTCGRRPCWSAVGARGYRFRDTGGAQAGTIKMLLRGDPIVPRTRLLWKAKGDGMPLPNLPLSQDGDVSVRVHNTTNENCWGADYPPAATTRNDEGVFKARVP